MKILITGGTGFIGKSLLKKLEKKKFRILVCSRRKLKNKLNVAYTKQDMGKDLNKRIKLFNPEILIHLAWEGIPDFSLKNCNENIKKNLFFLDNVSNLPNLKKIIITGSCLEYGSHNGICKEEINYMPNSYFSYSKNIIREFVQMICKKKNISFLWLRLFYVYGLYQRKHTIISTILDNLVNNKKTKIKNPHAKNDYIYIDDVIEAIIKSLKIKKTNSIINVGSGRLTSIYEMIKKIENILSMENVFSQKLSKIKKKIYIYQKKHQI